MVATKGSLSIQCEDGICVLKTTDTDFEISTELLEKHIGPDVIILNLDEFHGDAFAFGKGVIAANGTDTIDKLISAILDKTAILDSQIYAMVYRKQKRFGQRIWDSRDDTVVGALDDTLVGAVLLDRPTPDPDTRFASLAEDPVLAEIPADLRSLLDPVALIPSPTEGCDINRCVGFIPSADVFYFGPDPTNTACLATITSLPPAVPLPDIDMYNTCLYLVNLCKRLNDYSRDPSYVYVVYAPKQFFNGCRNWTLGEEHPRTSSYRPGELLTLEYRAGAAPATKTMDFADLPCPPSTVAGAYKPSVPYYPVLHPLATTYIAALDDEDSQYKISHRCEIAAIRDPPVHAHRVGQISGPKDGGDTIA